MSNFLESINNPLDLKQVEQKNLSLLAQEIREKIINTVSKRGGHLSSSLGAVELTIALHYVLNLPNDLILWDVGHQSYAHKILTGRNKDFETLRTLNGISGFPSRNESIYDIFTVGHSSTSISTALGLVAAEDIKNTNNEGDEKNKVVAVIGDSALAGGMAFEALNHAGHLKKDIIVFLNDNELSISPPVGALSKYLSRIISNPLYNKVRDDVQKFVKKMPVVGRKVVKLGNKFEEGLKNLLVPGILFEEMGFRYFGPIDGHDIDLMISTLKNITKIKGPVLVHLLTKKGKGYPPAEEFPTIFHSAPEFDIISGEPVKKEFSNNIETYTKAFGKKLAQLAGNDKKIVAITAAMREGTGLNYFEEKHPDRFFDVGIAEEHAIGFSAGLARKGLKPFAAIYATFLRRGYDQIVHDVCLQELPVTFAIDRAGLVGEDGPTHHGMFDIAYMRHIPHMTVTAAKDIDELEALLEFAAGYGQAISIRYPRAIGHKGIYPNPVIELGKWEILRKGKNVVVLAVGSMVYQAMMAAEKLAQEKHINITIVNARFIKPIDMVMLKELAQNNERIITIEEGILNGGFGSAVLEAMEKENILHRSKVKRLGLPDKFIKHGRRELLLKELGLDYEGIIKTIEDLTS